MESERAFNTIDSYIAQFSPETAACLQALRGTIRNAAPDASEKISWGMPTFFLNGNLVHFAAFKHHIGFYPGTEGIELFRNSFEESGLVHSKGAVQFPTDRPLPLALVTDIVRFRAAQNRTLPQKKKRRP